MAEEFDPCDKNSWYFGPLSRDETNEIFDKVRSNGVFLVRESQSIKGDYVLCVREDNKVSHYIVNRIQVGGNTMFRIGDQQFQDIPALLTFYKTHYLDTTPLTVPAPREKVIAKYDFPGQDPEDLPFRKGEILEILCKEEASWWTAKNRNGDKGQIPVPYVTKYEENTTQAPPRAPEQHITEPAVHQIADPLVSVFEPATSAVAPNQQPAEADTLTLVFLTQGPANQQTAFPVGQSATLTLGGFETQPVSLPKKLPAKAIVTQARLPNLYDPTQLRLNEGDIITVTKINPNGQWEGEINDKKGIFPFTHIKFLDDNS